MNNKEVQDKISYLKQIEETLKSNIFEKCQKEIKTMRISLENTSKEEIVSKTEVVKKVAPVNSVKAVNNVSNNNTTKQNNFNKNNNLIKSLLRYAKENNLPVIVLP